MVSDPPLFSATISINNASVISGAGRGKRIGIPTINVDTAAAPKDLEHGIYACFITMDGKKYQGAMHFGPRPVFKDSETLEVHVLDATLQDVPAKANIHVIGRIRDVQNFPTLEALQSAIAGDIDASRAMLQAYEKASPEHHS